ncbi:hypothetical protein K502DRAFT_154288 [Neoconidiobolus thromboides FSU 785]|nr:hypothetical protein K502DRAFT_154288 [Neoconidiobolus thromboides FSU 785]
MNSTTENKTLSDSESLYSLNAHYQNEIVSDLTSQIKGYHSELYLTSTIEKQGSCLSEFSLTHYESPPSIALKLQDANIKKGLLKEINYLYYVTDGQLNLWDFKKDLIQIELLEDQFKFISVVDIKKECFEESVIKGLLIGFQSKVYLYGIKIDEDKIQVLHTPYKFDCYCYENDLIASTNEGRIFLANNGDVLELKYQLKSSLFSKQTSVVNHTNYLSIITKFFDFRYKNLRGLQIDLERNTLYTLNKDTNIDIYDIKGDLFQWKATITHLSPTFLKNNQLKRAISKGIVKLNIIPKQKEDLIRLVLLTYDGTWIYLKSTDDKLINEVGNLEVSHFIIGNQDTTFKNTYYNGEYYNGMLMSCFIYEDNNKEDNIIQIKYSECASEYLNNKNVLVDQVNNEDKKSLFGIDTLVTYDIQSNFDQQERVMDFMEDKKIDNIMNINIKDYYSDNTNSQYYFYQRQIYILSNKKIYKLIKFRPIDQLKYILDNLIQLKNRNTIDLLNEENIINNKELKSFIIKYGIIETLSLCYLLLSKYPYFINNQFNKDLQLEDQHNKLNEYKPILNIILKNYQQYESLFNKSYIIVQVNGQQEKIEKKIQYLACIRGLAGILSPIFNTPLLKVNTNQNQQIVNIQFNNNITKLKFIQKSIYQFIVVLSQFSLFNSNNDNDLVQFYNNDRKLLPINQSNPLIDELIKVINRILELIEFLLLLFELNTLYLIKKLDQQSIINLSQLTFNDILNLNNNNNNTEFIEFIILGLINTIKELKEAKDTDSSVLEIIRQYCPTLISENEYYVYKAMEYLNLSLTQSNKFYKLDYQSKAESTLKLNKQPLSKRKLQLIVNLYLESNQPINAIQTIINNLKLISTIMTKEGHDNNNIINSEYYKLLELPLNHLLPLLKKEDMLKREEKEKSINNNIKFQYTPQTGYTQVSSTLTEYQTVLRFIETVLMELKDDQLYDYIYEYYIQNGLAYLLFDFKNEYLEKYLASSKVTANGQPILEVYYEYNQDYLKLTKLYTEKAMSNL